MKVNCFSFVLFDAKRGKKKKIRGKKERKVMKSILLLFEISLTAKREKKGQGPIKIELHFVNVIDHLCISHTLL